MYISFFRNMTGIFICSAISATAAINVPLQNATATFSQNLAGYSATETIDGIISGHSTSWAIGRNFQGPILPEAIVWETVTSPLALQGTEYTFNIYHQELSVAGNVGLGKFRLSYTIDDRYSFADGFVRGGNVYANWNVIDPLTYTSTGTETITRLPDSSLLVSGGDANHSSDYTVTALIPTTGITGFRLEALQDFRLPAGGPGLDPFGNFYLSEFVVSIPEPISVLTMFLGMAIFIKRKSLKISRIRLIRD
ncbi:MAG: hypothetical protein JEZ07_09715 [Phycisphaerae bacterium]|nr:hypothetical protein [Phycisphaerae bacterium]